MSGRAASLGNWQQVCVLWRHLLSVASSNNNTLSTAVIIIVIIIIIIITAWTCHGPDCMQQDYLSSPVKNWRRTSCYRTHKHQPASVRRQHPNHCRQTIQGGNHIQQTSPGAQLTVSTSGLYRWAKYGWNLGCSACRALSLLRLNTSTIGPTWYEKWCHPQKPEVLNVSQRRQRRTVLWPQATCKNWWSSALRFSS